MLVDSLIDAIGILGVVVFAVSGALAAGNLRLDPIGFLFLGTVTAIGGGTMRDLVLGRTVFWTADTAQLTLAMTTCLFAYFFLRKDISQRRIIIWSDALGLSAFVVQGTFIALNHGVPSVVAMVMGVMTAVGGGVLRDMLSGKTPMIFGGQLYASLAIFGAITVTILNHLGLAESITAATGFLLVFLLRGATLIFDIRMGPPGEFLRIGKIK